ncbi:glycerophosphodiester phosphodiesterase [Cryobacterium melibiosiphilum]|uniref:Glycerophosphodiester phosphodiesterase n=1 Tax=Cryobacterium melibiosiphilum TaxID=995039 RepID=A0A3A5MGH2_9MICO|nr:glycerophosphodiester phosphodiesterase family protein [Cryobacterium melibiosiphilum]RJT89250.1 glycerophosphodiester phosphodiesterase [Cryobacterium melibiosiphilum]
MARAGFFDGPRPRIFAHRGLALNAPENSLLAFVAALSNGATHLETDVHVTRDGVAVLSHDPDLGAFGRSERIDELSFAELGRIRLPAGQVVPSLSEALDTFPEAQFNIDVKADAAPHATIRAIRDNRATHRVLITSFSEARRRQTVAGLPGVATSPSSVEFARVLAAAAVNAASRTRRLLQGFAAVQVPERAGILRIVSPRFVRLMHSSGVEVHVWTVNEPAAMDRLLGLGVDGIVTDRSDLLAARVKSPKLGIPPE